MAKVVSFCQSICSSMLGFKRKQLLWAVGGATFQIGNPKDFEEQQKLARLRVQEKQATIKKRSALQGEGE